MCTDVKSPPRLLSFLRSAGLRPQTVNRLMDGRAVGARQEEGGVRMVSDHEAAGGAYLAKLGINASTMSPQILHAERERCGKRFRPRWYFEAQGVRFRFNDAFERWTNHGVQYAVTCGGCGRDLWVNCDRDPTPLCKDCRRSVASSPRCQEFPSDGMLACSTAYVKHGCRCEVCRAWKRSSRSARRLADSGPGNLVSLLQLQITTRKAIARDSFLLGTNTVTTPIPTVVREAIAAYESARFAWETSEDLPAVTVSAALRTSLESRSALVAGDVVLVGIP